MAIALASACSSSDSSLSEDASNDGGSPDVLSDGGRIILGDARTSNEASSLIDGSSSNSDSAVAVLDAGPPPAYCATNPWSNLEACGWPGPKNTGPDLANCPGGLTIMGTIGSPGVIFEVNQDNSAIRCKKIYGGLHVTAKNVIIEDVSISHTSGKTGQNANGTAVITVDDGASATINRAEINGLNGVHACIWHQGTSMAAHRVNCYGVNDGIFSWPDTSFSSTTGNNFTIDYSYIHDLTTLTANGHEDGYQTEGASNGTIFHNTFDLTTEADSAVAIWNGIRDSSNITIEDNLMAGGGAAVYAEDYSPSEAAPTGGFSLTNITLKNNKFSTHIAPCVGAYFVWYSRPAYTYGGGPTDGWHRTGNVVLETGENVDNGNPHVKGQLCQ